MHNICYQIINNNNKVNRVYRVFYLWLDSLRIIIWCIFPRVLLVWILSVTCSQQWGTACLLHRGLQQRGSLLGQWMLRWRVRGLRQRSAHMMSWQHMQVVSLTSHHNVLNAHMWFIGGTWALTLLSCTPVLALHGMVFSPQISQVS